MALKRIEGWEGRLNDAISRIRRSPFKLGEHDCLAAACASIEALTGIDLWPNYRGAYSTPREMIRFVRNLAGKRDFTKAFSKICGTEPISAFNARRGDVVEYRDDYGTQCLAVCAGSVALVPTEDSWIFVPVKSCSHAWRIG